MTEYVSPEKWLSTVRREYLQDFIRQGGAAVKFVVPMDVPALREIQAGLQHAAEEELFHFAFVDAASTKLHMVDKVFHQVAQQIDWDGLAYSFLGHILAGYYKLPTERDQFSLKQIALLNGQEEVEMRRSINNRLENELYRYYAMSQEFRIAMLRLCQAQLDPGEVNPALRDTVKEWLRGELRLISALKPALIFQKIGRHNARHMLFSLSHWLKLTGRSGLVLVLDISRYLDIISRYVEGVRPKEPDDTLYYRLPTVLDCYEVLREFIDSTDEMEFSFICVIAPPAFVDSDDRRGLWVYDALRLRIWDEVRDKRFVNPLSSLILVSQDVKMQSVQ